MQPRLSAWRKPLPEAFKILCVGIMVHGTCRSNGTKNCYHVLYIAHAKLSFVSGSDLASFPGPHPAFCCLQYVKSGERSGIIYYVSDVRVERRVEHG